MDQLLINTFKQLIQKIINTKYNTLDVSYKFGDTTYIDFIKQTELQENENVMKGMDDFERPFVVFKAEIIYENSKFNSKTFNTFFQRYTDDLLLWHLCGHDGPLLFDTVGGTNISQLKLLDELLQNGYIDLTPDMDNEQLKLNLNNTKCKPIKIQLGYSE